MVVDKKEDIVENWLEQEAKQRIGGDDLPIKNGFVYILSVYITRPDDIYDEFKGKKTPKKQWKIHFNTLKLCTDDTGKAHAKILQGEYPDFYDRILNFPKNTDTHLILAKTYSKQLAQFIIDNEVLNDTRIRLERTGTQRNTKYNFSLFQKKPNK